MGVWLPARVGSISSQMKTHTGQEERIAKGFAAMDKDLERMQV